jgi:hypothetical protein
MRKLIDQKEQIYNEQADKLLESNERMSDSVNKLLKDQSVKASGNVKILSQIKAIFSFDKKAMLGMTGAEKLQLAKMEYAQRKEAFNSIKTKLEKGEKSLVKDIDALLRSYKKDIDRIDNELDTEIDENRRKELKREKEDKVAKR